jgi:hypothetical protein
VWVYILHTISHKLKKKWRKSSKLPLYIQVCRFIESIIVKQPLVILFDEFDSIFRSNHSRATDIFRSLVNDPGYKDHLQVVCTSIRHPATYPDVDLYTSPWWNLFHLIPLNSFSDLELNEMVQRVGFEPDANLIRQLQELTGGHPWLVSSLLNAILDGDDLNEILNNPLSVQWRLGSHARHSFGVASALLGGDFTATLAALSRRESIDSREVREALWEAGAIRDPDENPANLLCGFLRPSG